MWERRSEEIKNPQEVTRVVAAVIFNLDGSRVLVGQRSLKSDFFPGQWEFVGGRIEPGENFHDAVKKEAFERAGLRVLPEDDRGFYVPFDYGGNIGKILTVYMRCVFLSSTHNFQSPMGGYDRLEWVNIIGDRGGKNLMTLGLILSDKVFAQRLLGERLLKRHGSG